MKRRTNAAGTDVPSGRNTSVLRWALFGSACFGVGFLCAVPLREAPQRVQSSKIEDGAGEAAPPKKAASAPPSRRRQRISERPFVVRPLDSCPAVDTDGERAYRVQQSRELIGSLRSKIKVAKHMQLVGGPEGIANQVVPWMIGWTDALVRTAPDLVDELAAEIETGMCDPHGDPAEQILLSRVLGHMPELINARGLDCIADRGKEDMVLWSALDVWRTSELPMSPALERLAKSAADDRTLSRLSKFEPKEPGPLPEQPPQDEPPVEYLPRSRPDADELVTRIARAKAEGTVTPMLAKMLEHGSAPAPSANAQAAEAQSAPAAAEEVP